MFLSRLVGTKLLSPRILGLAPCLEQVIQRRNLLIQEHMAMSLLKEHNVVHPLFQVAKTPEEAKYHTKQMTDQEKYSDVVIKAQVLAGGRGRGNFSSGLKGGVRIVFSPEEARNVAEKMIGHRIFTKQSGPDGRPCSQVLVQQRLYSRRETYFAIAMDPQYNGPVIVCCAFGGEHIEEIAEMNPCMIMKEPIDVVRGIAPEQAEKIANFLGFPNCVHDQVCATILKTYDIFTKYDCTLVEINPLAEDSNGHIYCMDCKINIDDNAKFRQRSIFALKDWTQENERDKRAAQADLNYIGLDGSIGCLVNGAGLAMATMDIIKLHNGEPANFLDVGGSATEQQIIEAFKLVLSGQQVNAVLVNIFGGIIRCDVVAKGIIQAAQTLNIHVPIVVRLQGTQVEEAKSLIANSQLHIFSYDDLEEAAQMCVKFANIVAMAKEASLNVRFEQVIQQ